MAGSMFFYIFFSLFTNGVAVRCFDCQHVPFPRDCAKVTECMPDEHCFTEKIETTSGHVVYNTGCRQKAQCSAINSLLVGKRLGYPSRRTSDTATCMECCPDNFCNMKGCGIQEIPLEQRGPYCYNCNSVIDPKACEHVAACLQNEVCLLYSPVEFQGLPETIYTSMCEKQSICDQHSILNMKTCTFHCCKTDFCNDQCAASTNISMTTETTQMVNLTTQTSSMTTEATLTSQNTKRTSEVSQTMYNNTIPTGNLTTESNLRFTTEETTSASSSTDQSTSSAPFQCPHQGGYQSVKSPYAQLCVHIVTHHSTWEHAREACKHEGGDLVVLDTHRKSLLLRHTLQSKAEYDHHTGYWIGAKYFSTHNNFSWINNLPLDKSETDWDNGEPDPHTTTHKLYCVEMQRDSSHSSQDFKWHDTLCSAHRNYICERK